MQFSSVPTPFMPQAADRNQQLQADNRSMQAQLERCSVALRRREDDQSALQASVAELRREQERLQARALEAEAAAQKLSQLAAGLQGAQAALEGQLAEARAGASSAAAQLQEATAAVAALRGERDGLASRVRQLEEGNAALEAGSARLRDHLQQSNSVLESCRQMLEESAAARWAGGGPDLQVRVRMCSVGALINECGSRLPVVAGPMPWLSGPLARSASRRLNVRPALPPPCRACRAAADDRAQSLAQLLRSLKAEHLLKEASMQALSCENAARGERLRALQQQLDALSAWGPGSHVGSPAGSAPACAAPTALCQRSAYPPPSPLPLVPGTSGASSRASVQASSTRDDERACALPGAASPPATFIPLSPHQHQQQQQLQQQDAAGASNSTGASPASPADDSLSRPPTSAMLARLLAPGAQLAAGGAPLALELEERQLSYLLQMVAEQRITTAQAQQVGGSASRRPATSAYSCSLCMLSGSRLAPAQRPERAASSIGWLLRCRSSVLLRRAMRGRCCSRWTRRVGESRQRRGRSAASER